MDNSLSDGNDVCTRSSTENATPMSMTVHTENAMSGMADKTAETADTVTKNTTNSNNLQEEFSGADEPNLVEENGASHDQSHAQSADEAHAAGVTQRVTVEVYMEMVVCRKITTQHIEVNTGKVLSSTFTTERDPPVVMDIHKVETTEASDTGNGTPSKVSIQSSTARDLSDVASMVGKKGGQFISLLKQGSEAAGGGKGVITVSKPGDAQPMIKQEVVTPMAVAASEFDDSEAADEGEESLTTGVGDVSQSPTKVVRKRGRPPGSKKAKVTPDSIITTRRQAAAVPAPTPNSASDSVQDTTPPTSAVKRRLSGRPARAIKKPRKFEDAWNAEEEGADNAESSPLGAKDATEPSGSVASLAPSGDDREDETVTGLELRDSQEVVGEEKELVENLLTTAPTTCSVCSRQFASMAACARHAERGLCGPPQTCSLCTKVFYSERSLERHMQGHRDEDKNGTYKCADCHRTYATRGGYFKHKRHGTCYKRDDLNEDGTVGDFRCGECNTRFKTNNLLKLHISKSHEPQDSKFTCQDCGRTFYSKQGFAKHQSAKSCTQPLRCLVCGKTYSNKARESFKVHMKHHMAEADGIQFQCEDCGRTYLTREALRKHSLTHSAVRPHKCPTCHKSFPMRYMVREHMRTHTGDKPFLCSLCGAAFGNRGHLYRHIRSHDMGTLHKRGRPRKNAPIVLKIAAKSKPGEDGGEELVMTDSAISVLEMKSEESQSLQDTPTSVISAPTYITVQTADGEVMVDGEVSQGEGQGDLSDGQLQHVVMTDGMSEPMVIQVIRDLTGGATVYQQVEESPQTIITSAAQQEVIEQAVIAASSSSAPQRHFVLTTQRPQSSVKGEATTTVYRPT